MMDEREVQNLTCAFTNRVGISVRLKHRPADFADVVLSLPSDADQCRLRLASSSSSIVRCSGGFESGRGRNFQNFRVRHIAYDGR